MVKGGIRDSDFFLLFFREFLYVDLAVLELAGTKGVCHSPPAWDPGFITLYINFKVNSYPTLTLNIKDRDKV